MRLLAVCGLFWATSMRSRVSMKNGVAVPMHLLLWIVFSRLKMRHGLIDVGSLGPRFTWSNGRSGHCLIRERLDKRIANGEWSTLFPRATIRVLPRVASDHSPVALDLYGAMGAGPKPFRFESCWARMEEIKDVVAGAWRTPVDGSAPFQLVQRIKATKIALRR